MAYKSIHEGFWTDPKITELSSENKFVYLYFITNPHTHFSGIYYLPKQIIKVETSLTDRSIHRGIDTLSRGNFVVFDDKLRLIFVRKMLRYQIKDGRLNDKQLIGLKRYFNQLHKTFLIETFKDEYPDLDIPINGVSIPIRISEPEPEPEPEPEEVIPYQELYNLYHSLLPELPSVDLTKELKAKMAKVWRGAAKENQNLEWWKDTFLMVKESKFLCGKNGDWSADLNWLMSKKNNKFNIKKVCEGLYSKK